MNARWLMMLALVGCPDKEIIENTDTQPPTRDPRPGDACAQPEDCGDVLVCSGQGVCAQPGEPGTGEVGDSCATQLDCQAVLVCDGEGSCREVGGPGTALVGDSCSDSEDCALGLACYQDACAGIPLLPNAGYTCVDDEQAPYQVHFDLEGGEDFYRLPFPSDVRRGPSGIDLSDHPTYDYPEVGNIGAGWLAAAADLDGFGGGANVFFRLSDYPEFDFTVGDLSTGAALGAVDLTPGPSLGTVVPMGWRARTGQVYLCDPWLTMSPIGGLPMSSGHTYGVIASTALVGEQGAGPPVQSATLQSMFDTTAPTDPALASAWEAMAPLRDGFETIPFDDIASAAVFTVQDVEQIAAGVRQAAAVAVAPTSDVLHLCGGTPGPLGGDGRGCDGDPAGLSEVQARITVPLIQDGTAPFPLPQQGGGASWADGRPDVVDRGPLELTIAVPDGPVPAAGWPVVLFAPGADGDYRSAITSGLAAMLADVDVGGSPVGFAVVTIDTWLTGARAGTLPSDWEARFAPAHEGELLYANPAHPEAARDNVAQSAIDWLTVLRWLDAQDWSQPTTSPTGAEVRFDLDSLHFVGTGIGALAGPLFAAHEPRVRSVVLANTGAGWMDGVAEADLPFPKRLLVGPLLGDGAVERDHPMLSIGQAMVDGVDPWSHAKWLHFEGGDKDVLVIHGQDDAYVGPTAQRSLSLAVRTEQLVRGGATAIENVEMASAPVTGNWAGRTAVTLVQGANEPHRLLQTDASTRGVVATFLGTAQLNGVATVP